MIKKTFKKVVQKEVVIEQQTIEQSYEFPLYLKYEWGDDKNFIKVTIDEKWEGFGDKFNIVIIETEYNETVINYITFDSCYCDGFLEYIEKYNRTSSKEEYDSVVSVVKDKLQ